MAAQKRYLTEQTVHIKRSELIKKAVSHLEKLCSRSRPLVMLYSYPYHRVVKNEISLTGITEKDKVLNIGCGAIPFTALLIAQFTGARVTAVDRDADAARLATDCVQSQGMAHLVHVVHGDGAEQAWAAKTFDVAIIALQAEPKSHILSNLLGEGQGTTRVVARAPSQAFRRQYEPLPENYAIAASIAQNMKTFDRSVLFLSTGASQQQSIRM